MIERRKLLGLGLGVLGASAVGPMAAFAQSKLGVSDPIGDLLQSQSDLAEGLPAEGLPAAAAPPVAAPVARTSAASHAPRWLKLHNIHTQEKLEAVYFDKGEYVPDAVQALDKVLRDYRTGDVYSMHPELFDTLSALAQKTETKSHFQVISGYRSPRTNAMLHERSGQVAKRSLHMDGKAMDVYLEDVALDRLRAAALDLGRGGVGYYPVSNFVHVDVGPVRRWVGS
ncbi:DUF882 domain-containing protein [Caulobacter sp. BE254]|jgi:uncharacterized protein YcbK (DUF882 family)|uniref:DUF882 domain-containing protein n=1 Tax=Caulobacter sp. BE254 TaxID=2817720 RepID=UPI002861B799|nr:DUF882 domain-containing protein [Caulobacter sp. BE254]MDR7116205.1 uncharacterized protein YcbK (DUF882 family) [Caulobacter sp. BE254]